MNIRLILVIALGFIFNDVCAEILNWVGRGLIAVGAWFSTLPEMFEFLS